MTAGTAQKYSNTHAQPQSDVTALAHYRRAIEEKHQYCR
jgi:hypothetical protein